jgi:polyisoprenoid-binding protein YceI
MVKTSTRMGRRGMIAGVVAAAAAGAVWLGPIPSQPATALAQPGGDGSFEIDASHSAVIYRIKHLGVAYNYGRFNDVSGSFVFDADEPEASSISVEIDTASVDSGNEKRDNHLRSPDFFNAKQFPTATFESTSVRKTGPSVYEVTGDFTMLGQTMPITATINKTGEGKDPWGGFRSGIETTFTIKRSDFGMMYMVENGGLGDEVRLTVALEGIRK